MITTTQTTRRNLRNQMFWKTLRWLASMASSLSSLSPSVFLNFFVLIDCLLRLVKYFLTSFLVSVFGYVGLGFAFGFVGLGFPFDSNSLSSSTGLKVFPPSTSSVWIFFPPPISSSSSSPSAGNCMTTNFEGSCPSPPSTCGCWSPPSPGSWPSLPGSCCS